MNPFSICYGTTNIENVVKYAGPGAIFIADFSNLHRPEFQVARSKGAELYAYRRPISCIVTASDQTELAYYMGDVKKVPLWGNGRRNNSYTFFTDLRVGSAWVDWMVDDIGRLITEGVCDGAFLDVLGARPWGVLSDWDNWPAAERAEWTAGSVDSLRRMHEARNRTDERFKLVCNNFWDLKPGDPSDALANTGDQYCNGVVLEHKASTSAYHLAYAKRTFGALPRRVLALAGGNVEAKAWSVAPGVTHVSPQFQYGYAEAPAVPFEDLRLEEERAWSAVYKSRLSDAEYDAAAAKVARDVAIAQRLAAQGMYDVANSERNAQTARLLQIHELSA